MSYGTVAINAAKLAVDNKVSPADAWQKTVCQEYPASIESQQKACPRNAFLGLCSEGLVKNIAQGNYTKSEMNSRYAKNAVVILKANKTRAFTIPELWRSVLKASGADITKVHNSQMSVVLALWDAGWIV